MITLDEARVLLRQAVKTQGPDFVYNPGGSGFCINVPAETGPEDAPQRKTGCLVGTAMSLSGVVDDMGYHKAGSVYTFRNFLTDAAYDYFRIAQTKQDMGSTWGEALEAAEKLAATLTGEVEISE